MSTADPINPILAEVTRGGITESAHRGAVVVADDHGRTVLSIGDVSRPIFPRSAVKLLQALPLVASGAAQALGLSPAALALACASHGGEPAHVETARTMLARVGLDEQVLECGSHWPSHEPSERALAAAGAQPCPLHNNCSGKHAGFVCLGHGLSGLRGAELAAWMRGYVEPDHPVMRRVAHALSLATDFDVDHTARGVDGCSIPTYAVPLHHLALGFARAGTGHGLPTDLGEAAATLRAAIAQAPFMVAGSGRFDTAVMQRLGTRLCCKVGAEGVYAASIPERGWGVALKMDDGNTSRAAEVVMAALLPFLLNLSDEERAWAQGLADVTLRNWQGREVGRLRAVAGIP